MAKCCHPAAVPEPSLEAATAVQVSLQRQAVSVIGWILPTTLLALMPKCPACVAAYAAAFTGIGLSLTAANYLRISAIVVAVALLLAMSAGWIVAFSRKSSVN